MHTRADYLTHKVTHEQYYSQFVTEMVLVTVRQAIGVKAILASTDPHFNDIVLAKWDALHTQVAFFAGHLVNQAEHPDAVVPYRPSLGTTVSIAKAAAGIIRERAIPQAKAPSNLQGVTPCTS